MLVPAQLPTQIDRYQPRFVLAPSPAPLEIIFCRAVLLSRGLDYLVFQRFERLERIEAIERFERARSRRTAGGQVDFENTR